MYVRTRILCIIITVFVWARRVTFAGLLRPAPIWSLKFTFSRKSCCDHYSSLALIFSMQLKYYIDGSPPIYKLIYN